MRKRRVKVESSLLRAGLILADEIHDVTNSLVERVADLSPALDREEAVKLVRCYITLAGVQVALENHHMFCPEHRDQGLVWGCGHSIPRTIAVLEKRLGFG